jgi:hypothetical protein
MTKQFSAAGTPQELQEPLMPKNDKFKLPTSVDAACSVPRMPQGVKPHSPMLCIVIHWPL